MCYRTLARLWTDYAVSAWATPPRGSFCAGVNSTEPNNQRKSSGYPITTPLLPHYYPRGSNDKPNNIKGLAYHYYTTTPNR